MIVHVPSSTAMTVELKTGFWYLSGQGRISHLSGRPIQRPVSFFLSLSLRDYFLSIVDGKSVALFASRDDLPDK